MNKIVVDTCLYIEWFKGNLLEHSNELLSNIPFLSSVVATELLAGAYTKKQQRELKKFISHYQEANRILTPNHHTYMQAGKCIENLHVPTKSLLGDSLIAMSARGVGAEVWTINKKDFTAINSVFKFKFQILKKT
jgi:predicted nucleic acid-binding protein